MAAVTANRRVLGLLGTTFLHGPFDAKNRENELRKMVEAQKEAMRAEAAAEAAPDSAKLATEAAEAAAVVEEQEEAVSPAERALIEKMAAKEAAAERVITKPPKAKKVKSSTRVATKADDSPAVVAITERYRTWRKALGRGDVEEAESAYTDIRNSIDDDKVEPRWSAKQRAAFNRWTPPRRCGWGMLGGIFRR